LNLAPIREQQLADILRDYDLYKQNYNTLSNQTLQSQMTTTLVENQQGQQFTIVDPPSLPYKSAGPDRIKLFAGGCAGGILLGIGLAFLIEFMDRSFHSESEISQAFAFPVVVALPLAISPAVRRWQRWKVAGEWIVSAVLLLTIAAAGLYTYRNG